MDKDIFGHKGEAGDERPGKFAAAARGTLLLDQIDALPLPLQAKVVHALKDCTKNPLAPV